MSEIKRIGTCDNCGLPLYEGMHPCTTIPALRAEREALMREVGVVGGISRCGAPEGEAAALAGDIAALKAVREFAKPKARTTPGGDGGAKQGGAK